MNTTTSYNNAQKAFAKSQTLTQLRNVGWSMNDQDLRQITNGTGGATNTFRNA